MTPTRLHDLTPLAIPTAVALRREPSRPVARRSWDRDTGEITKGQWPADRTAHRCDLPGEVVLDQGYALGNPNRTIASGAYQLKPPGQGRVQTDWEWADVWRDHLQFAARGALWESSMGRDGRLGPARMVHDFSAMSFAALAAPYEGAS